ncbi:MAG TPA: dimethylargininase [Rudaea sp.]|nr:dimethylargininase [Rudaea sp.]
MFSRAIVRPPAATFASGITSAALGKPDLALALEQHALYCAALEQCDLTVTRLPPDTDFPDSTFVEDTAIVTPFIAIVTRPGAPSRQGETASIAATLTQFYSSIHSIVAPGTVDAGDVCQVDDHFFIGISARTNEAGARQLAAILAEEGYTYVTVDIRGIGGILHLKSGISYLGDGRLVLIEELARHASFRDYEIVCVDREESYAANCLRVNDQVILAAGYPRFESAIRAFGYPVMALDVSEFRKMDGGLSCLSLRF